MSGTLDRDRSRPRPYLIRSDDNGAFQLMVRETRYNSQNYPVVTVTTIDETFVSVAAARTYAKLNFGAIAGEFAVPRRAPKRMSRG